MENRLRVKTLLFATLLALMALPLAGTQASAATVAAPTDTSAAGELAYWNQIKESGDAEDFETYMKLFPDGMFLDLAKAKQVGGPPEAVEEDSAETPEPPPVVKKKVKEVVIVAPKKKPRSNVFLGEKKRIKKIVAYKKANKKVRVKKARASNCPYVWRNGKCVRVAKAKYRKQRNKAVVYRPAVKAPPPKKFSYDGLGGGNGSSGGGYGGGGGGTGGGGSSWNQ